MKSVFHFCRALACSVLFSCSASLFGAEPPTPQPGSHAGFYRDPAVHGDTVVFTAEGDLWSVSLSGGAAHRITSKSWYGAHGCDLA